MSNLKKVLSDTAKDTIKKVSGDGTNSKGYNILVTSIESVLSGNRPMGSRRLKITASELAAVIADGKSVNDPLYSLGVRDILSEVHKELFGNV